VLLDNDDVGGSDVTILVPLALIEMLDEPLIEVPITVLLTVELNDEVGVVRFVPLKLVTTLVEVELSPLETVVLTGTVLLKEVVDTLDVIDKLEEVVTIVGSVAVDALTDLDEDEDDPVKVLDRVRRVDVEIDPIEEVECNVEEVECELDLLEEVECEVDLLEEVECEELLAVDEVLPRVEEELVVAVLPSTQSQSPVRYAAVYFWKGDEVLALFMGLA
jgi:hypothetical protein